MDEIEAAVMPLLLAGDRPEFATLRAQRSSASIRDRRSSGAGFFIDYDISSDVPQLGRQGWVFGDVYAQLEDLEEPVGFLLYVEDGRLSTLECFANGNDWPPTPIVRRAYYVHHPSLESSGLVEVEQRDFEWLLGGR